MTSPGALMADQVLKILNCVPELFLPAGDPRFDFLRWWFIFVVIVVIILIVRLALKSLRGSRNRPKDKTGQLQG
jgi:hypothetical protein